MNEQSQQGHAEHAARRLGRPRFPEGDDTIETKSNVQTNMETEMTIEAKLISAAGTVSTVQLPDDPSDAELMSAIGVSGDFATLGVIRGWEVFGGADTARPFLVIGKAPDNVGRPQGRATCTLKDGQASLIASLVELAWVCSG
jgi:hypothetical protein